MVRKWIQRLLIVFFVFSLAFVLKSGPHTAVRAQAMTPRAYFPIAYRWTLFDNFADEDPVWYVYRRETKDGTFFHRNGRLVGLIDDNRANNIAYPEWRPLGDFKVEVNARFVDGRWMNALGLVFAGNDSWDQYYLFVLAHNTNQHHWNVGRAKPDNSDPNNDVDIDWFQPWEGTPSFVDQNDSWNRLAVVRVGSSIHVYVNGRELGSGFTDSHYGTQRQVGVIATSYEWTQGENEYDNFEVTPLSSP